MNAEIKLEIEKLSKEFTKGMDVEIKGSGFLVVDPLSAYLNFCGFKNGLAQYPATDKRPQVLILIFLEDGTGLIPAGSDLGVDGINDWHWTEPKN